MPGDHRINPQLRPPYHGGFFIDDVYTVVLQGWMRLNPSRNNP